MPKVFHFRGVETCLLFTVVVFQGPGSPKPQLSIPRRYRILLRSKSELERCHKQLADQVGVGSAE